MKFRLDVRGAFSFRSLRLRLILYLFLVGSVPLLLALFVFYQQSVNYAQSEYQKYVTQNHAMIAERMERSLAGIAKEAKALNADPRLQQFMLQNVDRVSETIREVNSDIYDRFADNASGQLLVSDVCMSFYQSDVSLCRDTTFLLSDSLQGIHDVRLETVTLQSTGEQMLRFIAPLYELFSKEVKGYIVVLIDHSRLLNPPNYMLPIINHALVNNKGIVLIGVAGDPQLTKSVQAESARSFVKTTGDSVISGKPIDVFTYQWTSVIQWENRGYADLRQLLGQTAAVFFLLLALLSITISILFSRSVTRPIQRLRSLMKRAELGDLKAYWSYHTTRDIDELGESYNQMLNRLEDLIKQVKIEESLKKEKEFEALQYQLNPHFLYNTLNTIKWVAKIHKTPQISEAVNALVRLMQASLGKKGDFLPLQEEVGLVRDYMAIQMFRYGDEIQLEAEIEPVAGLCLVPKMILQPLVENAIIHGLDQMTGKDKKISIKAWIDRDLLVCEVADNGKGIEPELLLSEQNGRRDGIKEKMSGIGIRHIREKIKLYYGPDYKMLIFSKPNQGTTIRMSLPIHRSEEQ